MALTKQPLNAIDRAHPAWYLLPAASIYVALFLVPILVNVVTAFTDWNAYRRGFNFIGLDNFVAAIESGDLLRVTKTTFLYSVAVVTAQNVFGFSLAMALERKSRASDLLRAIFFVPCVVAIVVWGILFNQLLHPTGLVNQILSTLTGSKVSIIWLGSVKYTIFVVAAVNSWMWTGFHMVIYIAAINAIPPDLIEAGKIDGLGYCGRIWHVILPLIMQGISINVVLSTIGTLKVFDIVMVLTKTGPGGATNVYNTWIYEAFGQALYGYASAINIFLIVLVTVIAYPLYFRMNRRVVDL